MSIQPDPGVTLELTAPELKYLRALVRRDTKSIKRRMERNPFTPREGRRDADAFRLLRAITTDNVLAEAEDRMEDKYEHA